MDYRIGLFLIRVSFWGAIALFVIIVIIGVLIDLWRWWYGILIIITALWLMIKYFVGGRDRGNLVNYSLVVFSIAIPYLILQAVLFFVNVESSAILRGLDEGFGLWRCGGNYTALLEMIPPDCQLRDAIAPAVAAPAVAP